MFQLLSLKHSYAIIIFTVIFSIVIFFIDSKINSRDTSKKDYIKLSILVTCISAFVVYVNTLKGFVDEEILNTVAPF